MLSLYFTSNFVHLYHYINNNSSIIFKLMDGVNVASQLPLGMVSLRTTHFDQIYPETTGTLRSVAVVKKKVVHIVCSHFN